MLIMGDGALSPNISDSAIDFNLISELLFDGFWLEATEASSTLRQPTPTAQTDFITPFPTSEFNIVSVNPYQYHHHHHQDFSKSSVFQEMDECSSLSLNQSARDEESQVSARLWVGPSRDAGHDKSVKRRLVQAINFLKESIRDKDVLVQIWIPDNKQGKQVLRTSNQLFSLNPSCKSLANYRDVSKTYQFVADVNSTEFVGLLGRVFLNRLPEWTPDVRFFRREEYPRVTHAQQCNVRGSLALPVLEQGSGICLAVVEVVTTRMRLDFHPELQNVCKALEAVDLKSSNILCPYNIEDYDDDSYQGTLMEIRNVLKFSCDTYKLPLAQVWASCLHRRRGGCRHSDENYAHCVSTIDTACYVADARVTGFHEACSQHHLLKGEGVAGKAFLTNQSCFAEDITAFTKTEYPLAHHARVFNLCASAAIRLRSARDVVETTDFVLEFFLPLNCRDARDRIMILQSLSSVIQEMCLSLRVVTDQELVQESSGRGRGIGSISAATLDDEKQLTLFVSPSNDSSQLKGEGGSLSSAHHALERGGEFKVTTTRDNPGFDLHHMPATLEQGPFQQDSGEGSGSFSLTVGKLSLPSKTSEKKHKRTDTAVSLEVLRQYFAGSLKEAAKNIGVCPTTLKRICRQHGITRWPSRKIKKVGHSLRKLQLVINSVQDSEGSIQLSPFYNNLPDFVSPKLQGVNNAPEGNFPTSKPPSSSGSHSSSCSAGVKQSSLPVKSSSNGDEYSTEQNGGVLKKARSDAELQGKGQVETKLMTGAATARKRSNQASHEVPFRAKAAFGEEKIRLSLQPHWDFEELREEVLTRFNIDNGSGFNLKYLDDDAEWVLLTCDDDLEECRDIHRSSKSRTIKLSVIQACHPGLGSSFGSDRPY